MKNKIVTSIIFIITVCFLLSGISRAGKIHKAIKAGNIDYVRTLLKKNPQLIDSHDNNYRTPLHIAVKERKKEIVQLLLKYGADCEAEDYYGQTPRKLVGYYGYPEIEECLRKVREPEIAEIKMNHNFIQGTEHQVPGIYITGHPPTPPAQVYRVAYVSAALLLVLAGLLQFCLKKYILGCKDDDTNNGKQKNDHRTCKTFFIILFVILFYFIMLEGILQVYVHFNPYQVFIPDPQSHWKVNPAISRVQGNDPDGNKIFILDNEYRYNKKANSYRIVCMGDSQTLGIPWAGKLRWTFPKLLQKKLRDYYGTKQIEVINMGVSGYSSFQGLLLLKNIAMLYNPDCIIVGYGYHDGGESLAPDRDITSGNAVIKKIRSILYRSQIYLMIRRKVIGYKVHNIDPKGNCFYKRVSLKNYRRNLKEFAKTGQHSNTHVIFFIVPQQGKNGTIRPEYADEMRKTAKKLNIPLVDGAEAMQKISPEQQERFFFKDRAHFTKEGNDFISDVLCSNLKPILDNEIRIMKNDEDN